MLYKTSPISSTNQCHFEKEGEEGLWLSHNNLIQGMVLDWILIWKNAVNAILGPTQEMWIWFRYLLDDIKTYWNRKMKLDDWKSRLQKGR